MSISELEKVTKPIASPTELAKMKIIPLASLMDVLNVLIERYEDEQVPELTDKN